ncbi:cryptochrome/photolyase family protein [Sulfuriroseicoccus oceanibius]|uniref:Cryptochrome/photolyase family protein n=1 Tax=Sulfuriroseicoccus oceanibius TaxID=2707525 RepID=A0A6B3LDY0_9BACT|nr:cryptochrome/photolyase family protein [Sulfuriroseicoccus oceanibius]QQL45160.1 cryptochrome/photolyase family protein [Sulfuriroseicoccus oceanibius]
MRVGLVFPHQLFDDHPALEGVDRCVLVDEPLLYWGEGEWRMTPHAKRVLLLKAAGLAYAQRVEKRGMEVECVAGLDEVDQKVNRVRLCRVVDDELERKLTSWADERGVDLEWLDTPGFVTPREWSDAFFGDGKKPFMKTFYEAQRKRMKVLVDGDGQPAGGQWSFDADNRKKLPKKVAVPDAPRAKYGRSEQSFLDEALAWVEEQGDVVGGADGFRYPITHDAAAEWLERFLDQRFAGFGTYEDALSTRGDFLFHSVLTPMLNIGLLTPGLVVERTLEFAEKKEVPINDLEGFVRQIIGWREFVAIVYLRHGRGMRSANFWQFEEPMPQSILNWKTGIDPVDYVLEKVEREGYAHHIERLMILGNFMLLLRIHPHEVYRWFMDMFVDAYDWVMVPNVYGMSQFSDGGSMVTKPYISGSNYVLKMSDFKKGEWCAVWDALYWSFVADHRVFFESQYRMRMMVSHLDRMGAEKVEQHRKLAAEFRQAMRDGKVWGALL